MSNIFRSLSRCLSIRGSSSSSSSSLPSPNPLTEEVTQPEELSPKHNIFEEEVCFEDINQAIDNWKIPKIPQDQLYVPDDNKRKSNYIIKTAENNIPLGPESGEEFHLLTKQSVREHTRHYKYLHIGCVQANVTIPRLIKWDEIDLPRSWSIDRAIPTQPRQAPLLQEIKQDETGRVEIVFDSETLSLLPLDSKQGQLMTLLQQEDLFL
ncbi:hypothetical protein PIB30_090593 [Stylosanthes scabra]|uniref:Uncharacterized protein n=1 Tax=Stylosanthes scabra TaxID=79078 RepID=A0ABU6XWT0_9FABA|nr:hypothetical protein [Stylosanthes scabra]